MPAIKTIKFDDKWDFQVFPPDTDPAECAPFEAMKKLWDSKRTSGSIPAWRDFNLRDFEGWYGCLTVEDIVSRSPYDGFYRLWGSTWVDVFHVDMTGKHYSDQFEATISQDHRDFWGEMCLTPNIGIGRGAVSWLDRTDRFYGQDYRDIALPLSNDGVSVDGYLTILHTGTESSQGS